MTFEWSSLTEISRKSMSGSSLSPFLLATTCMTSSSILILLETNFWYEYLDLPIPLYYSSRDNSLIYGECCLAMKVRKHARDKSKYDSYITTYFSYFSEVRSFIFRWMVYETTPRIPNADLSKIQLYTASHSIIKRIILMILLSSSIQIVNKSSLYVRDLVLVLLKS